MTFILKIALVRNNDDWELIHVLYSENLLIEGADFLERVAGSNGVDEQEALARAHVLLTHRTESLQ